MHDAILELSSSARPFEIGGVLLGRKDLGIPIVTDIIGPGPNSRATRVSFEPDYDYQQQRLDVLFDRSGGDLEYLGDWHSHPSGACAPSATDRGAMRAIRSFDEARCPDPVMVICGGGSGSVFRAFRLSSGRSLEMDVLLFR